MRMRKAQVFAPDLVTSLVIFSAMLGLSLVIWNAAYSSKLGLEEHEVMKKKLDFISESLLRTSGYPQNWTQSTVQYLGIAGSGHVIDPELALRLKEIEYDKLRRMLGLGHELYMAIEKEGMPINYSGAPLEYGLNYEGRDYSMLMHASRLCLFNRSGDLERANFRMVIWR